MKTPIKFLVIVLSFLINIESAKAQSPPQETDSLSINLQQAINIAVEESPIVKIAEMEVKKKRYIKKSTKGALFPQIDVFSQYSRTIKKQTMYLDGDFPMGGKDIDIDNLPPHAKEILEALGMLGGNKQASDEGIQVGRFNVWTAGVGVNIPIIAPALWRTIELTSLDVEMALEETRDSKLKLIAGVKRAYYTVLLAQDSYQVYKDMYENEKKELINIESKYNEGLVAEFDLITAQVRLQTIRPEMIKTENALAMAKLQLKAMMGINLDTPLQIAGQLSDYQEKMLTDFSPFRAISGVENYIPNNDRINNARGYQLIEQSDAAHSLAKYRGLEGLENNSQLRRMDVQAKQLHKIYKVKQAQFMPKLVASFKYQYMSQNNDLRFRGYKWDPFSTFELSLSVPIFSGGTRTNEVKAAKISMQQLAEQRTEVERNLRLAVQNQEREIVTSIEQIQALRSTEEQAQKGYTIALKRYETGMGTLLEVNQASLAIANVRLQKHNAIYSYLTAKSELEKLSGEN